MTTSKGHGWRYDQPCPSCVTNRRHLRHRLQHRIDDFWHEGPELIVTTQGRDHSRVPIEMRIQPNQ